MVGADYFFQFVDLSKITNLASEFQLLDIKVGFVLARKGCLLQLSRDRKDNHVQLIIIGLAMNKENLGIDQY